MVGTIVSDYLSLHPEQLRKKENVCLINSDSNRIIHVISGLTPRTVEKVRYYLTVRSAQHSADRDGQSKYRGSLKGSL